MTQRAGANVIVLTAAAAVLAGAVGAAGAMWLSARGDADGAAVAELRGQVQRLSDQLDAQQQVTAGQARTIRSQELSLTELGDMAYRIERQGESLRDLVEDLAAGGPLAAAAPRASTAGAASTGPGPYAAQQRAEGAGAAASGGAAAAGNGAASSTYGSVGQVLPEIMEAARLALTEQREQDRVEREQRELVERTQRAERQVSRLTERLVLAPEQQQSFAMLLFERDEARRNSWRQVRSGGLDRDEARTMSEDAEQVYEQALQRLLSARQYAELEAVRAEREQREESGRRDRTGGGRR